MWFLANNAFGNKGTFIFSFVGQHCSANHVANGINTFNAGFHMLINGNFSAALLNGQATADAAGGGPGRVDALASQGRDDLLAEAAVPLLSEKFHLGQFGHWAK